MNILLVIWNVLRILYVLQILISLVILKYFHFFYFTQTFVKKENHIVQISNNNKINYTNFQIQ